MEYRRERLKWNGWGWQERTFDLHGGEHRLWAFLQSELGLSALPPLPAATLDAIPLPGGLPGAQRQALADLLGAEHVCTDRYERIFHAVGRSYWDLLRLRQGRLERLPDAVVYPHTVAELSALLSWASDAGVAVVPYGGGSSIVGGVEAARGAHTAVVTADLLRMSTVTGIDPVAMTATAQAGIYGPALEEALQAERLTLGHYPLSFEFSTLGGWIATRGSGQQSYRYGSAADFFAGATVVTPSGVLRTTAHPNSAAGPDLRHLLAGSEGTLGIIAEATVRLREVPAARDYRGFLFPDFASGAEAIRQLVQEGIEVAMLRLSDMDETYFLGQLSSFGRPDSWLERTTRGALGLVGGGKRPCLLLVGLEGPAATVSAARVSVARVVVGCGGLPAGAAPGKGWYASRFMMPYLRDALLDHGVGVATVETAISWPDLTELHRAVREKLTATLREVVDRGEGRPIVMAHISHAYRDGASLYFTFVFPIARRGARAQWRIIQRAAVTAVLDSGGTLSHHHGVGRALRGWLVREKGELGVALLRAAKQRLDPQGIMNPGKLLPSDEADEHAQ